MAIKTATCIIKKDISNVILYNITNRIDLQEMWKKFYIVNCQVG